MAASKNNNAHTPELTIPASIAQTMRLVQRVAHAATWGERIARQHLPPAAANFGSRLFRRFDAAHAPGQWADSFAQRFIADELAPSSSALTLAPHAPAQRQVSAARQGALSWSGGDPFAPSGSPLVGGTIARETDFSASQSLVGDLMSSGWSMESARSDSTRPFAEPASQAGAPPVSRSNVSQAPTSQSTEPIRRTPMVPPSAPAPLTSNRQADAAAIQPVTPAPLTINRQADAAAIQPVTPAPLTINRQADAAAIQPVTPAPLTINRQADAAVSSSGSSSAASTTAETTTEPDSADSATTASSAANDAPSSSPEATPTIQTAANRPMTFFRGTPQSPLMRMGLSESTGGSDNPEQPTTSQIQPASGELPVVRPAHSSDGPSLSGPSPASAPINRRVDPSPSVASSSGTSSSTIDRAASGDRSEISATADIQHSPTVDPEPAAQLSTASGDSEQATTTASSYSPQPDVQRQATTESRPTSSSSGAESTYAAPASGDHAAPAATASADTAAAPSTADTVMPVQRSAAAASTPASAETPASTPPSTPASTETPASPAETAITSEDTPPAIGVTGQRATVIHRQPVQPARTSSVDTVLPLATKLLQRYSTGTTQETSGSMPLLRTFVPTTAAVMRNVEPGRESAPSNQAMGNSERTSATSTTIAHLPPLVHRSPIVPLLPTATLQREPAPGSSVAAPAPRPTTAPALEWSALPLLQRLSVQHSLPASTAARQADAPSSAAAQGASVAAHVLQRFALDTASGPAMPLLRMQPSAPVMRTSGQPHASSSAVMMRSPGEVQADTGTDFGTDVPAGPSFAGDQVTAESTAPGSQTAPSIHRSAILPSLSAPSFQPLTLLRVQAPDAQDMTQADAVHNAGSLQRSPSSPGISGASISPIMMRTPEQPSMSALASVSSDEQGSPTSATSTTIAHLPPLVHRSPIVPLLPTATLQREPAPGSSVAAPAPRPTTAPALEWSALPLLQRLSVQHSLPASTAARQADAPSSAAAQGASVAAHVLQRFALDTASGPAMPLLRMQAPQDAPMLSRESEQGEAESRTASGPDSATELAASPELSSFVRRSAIVPAVPSLAVHEPATESATTQAAEANSGSVQRSEALDWSALPMLQRSSIQRFFGSGPKLPGLKIPNLGGIQNSIGGIADQARSITNIGPNLPLLQNLPGNPQQVINGARSQATGTFDQLRGQAQGMFDQVTGLPGQLQDQAQGMFDQVTGLPGQLQDQAQGMFDQVTGLPDQLRGQAQGMFDQVTGLPGQLQGQAQGMFDQVTGLPGQLRGQAQGMFDQVTGLPGQLQGQAQGMFDQVTGLPDQIQGAASNLMSGRGAELTLLRPVRAESQSAAVREENETGAEAGAQGQPAQHAAGGSGATAKGEAGKQGKPDIEMLAQQVYARLRHRLLIDRERLGR